MASRDLTKAFLEHRNAANLRRRTSSKRMKPFAITSGGLGGSGVGDRRRDSGEHLLDEGDYVESGDLGSEGSPQQPPNQPCLPPRWVDDVDSIRSCVHEIERSMGLLSTLHANRLNDVFGSKGGGHDEAESEIERLAASVTDRFRTAEHLLKKVGRTTQSSTDSQEKDVGANVQRSLALALQELSTKFRSNQRAYLQGLQNQNGAANDPFGISSELPSSSNGGGDDFGYINGGNDDDGGGLPRVSTQALAVVDDLHETVQTRDEEITKIARNIEELGSIFKELAVLVIDQGTILDRIDYNMETVVEHTKEGIIQLEKAEKHQRSARPMKCIVSLLFIIGILLTILVFKHRRRRHY